ncbi:MAG: Hsp20/alpha crystallin family protein [Microvirga sp.]
MPERLHIRRARTRAGASASATFERSIALPFEVEEEKAEASFKNGVLTVTIPKSATAKDTAEHMAGSEGEAIAWVKVKNPAYERPVIHLCDAIPGVTNLDRSLVRIRSKGARRCLGNRIAGRHAWLR